MGRLAFVSLLALVPLAAGCGGGSLKVAASHGPLEVVAAENFWGSLAAQLGGSKAHVTSVITSPATDPHDYEPTAADGRLFAGARLAIVNGVGYDPWADKLLASGLSTGGSCSTSATWPASRRAATRTAGTRRRTCTR